MRQWQGIRGDTADTASDGALFASNTSFFIDGEMRRRPDLTAFAAQSGTTLANYYSGMTGNWAIFDTAAGTVEAIAAP